MKKQGGFAHILVLILVVIGIGALGYFSLKQGIIKIGTQQPAPPRNQTEDETANWETYTTANYQIKYPNNLTSEIAYDGKLFLYAKGITPELSETFVPNIVIGDKYDKPNSFTDLKSWALSNQTTFENITEISGVAIGNNEFLTFESDSGPTAYALHYLIENEATIFDFKVRIVGSNEEAGELLLKYLPQILSTFKFNTSSESNSKSTYNMDFYTNSNSLKVQLLLTDDQNRSTGYKSTNKLIVQQIPNSSYGEDKLCSDDGSESCLTSTSLNIVDTFNLSYTLEVYGLKDTEYTVEVRVYNNDKNTFEKKYITGEIKTGIIHGYTITPSKNTDQIVEIKKNND